MILYVNFLPLDVVVMLLAFMSALELLNIVIVNYVYDKREKLFQSHYKMPFCEVMVYSGHFHDIAEEIGHYLKCVNISGILRKDHSAMWL